MKKSLIIAAVASVFALASCNPDPAPVPDSLEITSKTKVEVTSEAQDVEVTFKTNAAWTATSSQTWAVVEPAKGEAADAVKVKVKVAANEATDARTAKISVVAGTAKGEVEIAQVGKDAAVLTISKEAIEAPAAGIEETVDVTANYAWKAEASAAWVTVNPAQGNANATVKVTVAASQDEKERTATVKFTSEGIERTIAVSQAAFVPPFDGKNINKASDLVALLSDAAKCASAETSVTFTADIDLAGVDLPKTNFAGTIDGAGKSIKNWASSQALVDTLAATGVIKNLVIDATCAYTITTDVCGVVTKVNKGTIEGVTNNAKVTYEGVALTTEHNFIGVMAAISEGTVKNCVNNGEVKVHFTSAASKQLHLAGVVASIVGKEAVVEGNTNNAPVTAEFDNIAKNTMVGGVLASTPSTAFNAGTPVNYINVKDCHNTGAITWKVGKNKNGSYCNVGGVAGYVEGTIEGCTNSGTIHLEGDTLCATKDDITTRQAGAGVAAVAVFGAKSCSNSGTIEAPKGSFAGGTKGNAWCGSAQNPCFAGVVSCVGTSYLDKPIEATEEVVEDCHNTGKIELSCDMAVPGATHILVGGVVAINSGITKNCTNKGELINKAGHKCTKFGGIIGTMSNIVTDCINEGVLTHDVAGKHDLSSAYASQLYMGGVVGYIEIKGAKIIRCTNKGKLSALNGWNEGALSYLGGVLGTYNGSQNEMEDCINDGEIYVDSKAAFRIGGLASQMNAIVKNSTNNGNITVKNVAATSSGKQTYVGGLLGYHNGVFDENIVGCTNNGNITVESPNQASDLYVYANGLVASLGNQDNEPFTISFIDCVSAGVISNPQGRASAIFGCWHSGAPAAGKNYILNLGKEGHPITVKSTCTVNGAKATEETLVNDTFGNTVNKTVVIE